jgi:hypothetical protein
MPNYTVSQDIDDFMKSDNDASARTELGLGSAATSNSGDFASSVQGDKADTALQPSDIGSTVQAQDSVLDNTTASFTTAQESKLTAITGTNTGDQDLSALATKANVLELDNTSPFTPSADNQPATKKYVDDNAGGGAVDSVNTQTGAVVLDADDIDDSSTTNKFATQAELDKANSAIQSGDNVSTLTNDAGYITTATAAPVDSVNTQTGAVVLDADDISDASTTNKFTTQAEADKLAAITGTNTGDQDLSGLQSVLTEGAFVDGDKTKLDDIEAGATKGGTAQDDSTLAIKPRLDTKNGSVAGDTRGIDAIDLQVARNASTQVASATRSMILSGSNNTASNSGATVIAAQSSNASGSGSVIIGGSSNNASGSNDEIIGSQNSTTSGTGSTIVGGSGCINSGNWGIVLGGLNQQVTQPRGSVIGGSGNIVNHVNCAVIGGTNITTDANDTVFVPSLNVGAGFKMPTGATNNYVLTSDANGVGTWRVATGGVGGSGGTVQGTDQTYDIQATNEGTLAGNARGENSVDLQTLRAAATQTASGSYSVIVGGKNNTAASTGSVVGGGTNNNSASSYTTISGGLQNTVSAAAQHATIGGGQNNTISDAYSGCTIGGGSSNNASMWDSTVSGGNTNTASAYRATVSGGMNNTASSDYSTVGGGLMNLATTGIIATVCGGLSNTASGYVSVVGGGFNNSASGDYSAVLGGSSNGTNGLTGAMIAGSNITAQRANTLHCNNLTIKNIPTSSAGLTAGDVWNDSGTLKII